MSINLGISDCGNPLTSTSCLLFSHLLVQSREGNLLYIRSLQLLILTRLHTPHDIKGKSTSKATWNTIIRLTYSSQKYSYPVTEKSLSGNTSISHYSLHFIFPSFIPCLEPCSFPPISTEKKNQSLSFSGSLLLSSADDDSLNIVICLCLPGTFLIIP